MKVMFMGTPDYAAAALKALIDSRHEVVLVVTNPDKPAGRGGKLTLSPVKELALAGKLEVFQPERIRNAEAQARLEAAHADIGVVAAFGQILSAENLRTPRHGCINIHASLLPAYRGSSPIQQAILDGAEETGVTIMQMDEGVDTGDILMQEKCTIDDLDTAGTLFDKLSAIGASLLIRALDAIEEQRVVPVKQEEALATRTGKISKDRGMIRWQHEASYIARHIRAMSPWPSAYTRLPDGRILKIWRALPVPDTSPKEAGIVTGVTEDFFLIRCGSDALKVTEIQLEGKKRMSVHDFLLGYDLEEGICLR
ncbi:MAG: methionyl-tRNA formyltransferase [Lachnospiraceae bacterium]|nr:methionyl-tRNA formyltransferase [Lachnospiraceae bacterium]